MAGKTYWIKDGKLLVDSSGKAIFCDHCPCVQQKILVLLTTTVKADERLYFCSSDTDKIKEYYSQITLQLREEGASYEVKEGEKKIGSAFNEGDTSDAANYACVAVNKLQLKQVDLNALCAGVISSNKSEQNINGSTVYLYNPLVVKIIDAGRPYAGADNFRDADYRIIASNKYPRGCTGEKTTLTITYTEYLSQAGTNQVAFNCTLDGESGTAEYTWISLSAEWAKKLTVSPKEGDSTILVRVTNLFDTAADREHYIIVSGSVSISKYVDDTADGVSVVAFGYNIIEQRKTKTLTGVGPGSHGISLSDGAIGASVDSLTASGVTADSNDVGMALADPSTELVSITIEKGETQIIKDPVKDFVNTGTAGKCSTS